MIDLNFLPPDLHAVLKERLGDHLDLAEIPPPVFKLMRGEIIDYDLEAGTMTNRFPVLNDYLNSFGLLHGGMIAAAIDNTIGPLSMLMAPPNVTRELRVKYRKPATLASGHLIVTAHFSGRDRRLLSFTATVADAAGDVLAGADSTHWVVGQ